MKKVRKYIVAWALVVVAASGVFFNPLSSFCEIETVEALAAEDNTYGPQNTQNQYGRTDWPSLKAAQDYYGKDYSYSGTAGHPYNYFYQYSDGSRMYFGVKEQIR